MPPDDKAAVQPCPLGWIEIELVGDHGQGIPDEPFRLVSLDGQVTVEGKTDAYGLARVSDQKNREWRLSFPRLSADAWEPVGGR